MKKQIFTAISAALILSSAAYAADAPVLKPEVKPADVPVVLDKSVIAEKKADGTVMIRKQKFREKHPKLAKFGRGVRFGLVWSDHVILRPAGSAMQIVEGFKR